MANDEININVKIKFRTLLIGIILTIVIAFLYWVIMPIDKTINYGYNDVLNSIIQILGIGIALTTLVYIAANQHQLLKTQKDRYIIDATKDQREVNKFSAEVMRLWSSREVADYTITARKIWQENKDKEEKNLVNTIICDEKAYISVITILNFLDWVSQLVKDDVVNEQMMKNYYYVVFRTYKERFFPLISYMRKEAKSDLVLKDFTNLEEKWDSEKI